MTFIENRESIKRPFHELAPVGEIIEVSHELVHDIYGRNFERRQVIVGDESDRDPEKRNAYFEKANKFEAMLKGHPEWQSPYVSSDGQLVVDRENLAADDLYFEDSRETQMFEWGHQMMQAIALEPLQNLGRGGQFLSRGHLDQRTLERFTFMPDGRGLRSRQHIYSQLLVEQAKRTPGETLNIISLGSGAAVPNIEASQRIERETGKWINWQLFDLDPNALFHAQSMTNRSGLSLSRFDFGPQDSDPNTAGFAGRSYIEARHQANESLDAVDALGLWEYLEQNQAVMFLKMMYAKLKPGAPMIVSNMRKERPQPEYNMRAVGWPKLIMRNEQDLLDIVQLAKIDTKQVTITHSTDGVYAVMEVVKV